MVPSAQKPWMKHNAEMQEKLKGPGAPGLKADEIIKKVSGVDAPAVPVDVEDEDEARGKSRPGQVSGRDKRHAQRNERAKLRKDRHLVDLKGGKVLLRA